MENWGCEFLTESDRTGFIPREPWRSDPHVYVLDIAFILSLADKKTLHQVQRDHQDYLKKLEGEIKQEGLKTPAELRVSNSSTALFDGYHRLICCANIGFSEFPVYIVNGPVKLAGKPNSDLIPILLRNNI